MDIIHIHTLKIDTLIGIHDWERRTKQTIHLDLDIAYDNRAAVAADNIDHALNYRAVAERLKHFINQSECFLI